MSITLKINGTEYELPEGVTLIGRGSDADITVDNQRLSSTHARFMVEGDSVSIEDLGSTNGTFVNGQKLTDKHTIVKGDVIKLGEVECTIILPGAANKPAVRPVIKKTDAVTPAPERIKRSISRKEKEYIRNGIIAVIVFIVIVIGYNKIMNQVPPELLAARETLTRIKAETNDLAVSDDAAANQEALEQIDIMLNDLKGISAEFAIESQQAKDLSKELQELYAALNQRNKDLQFGRDAETRLAALRERLNAGSDNYFALNELTIEAAGLAASLQGTPFAVKADALEADIITARDALAKKALHDALSAADSLAAENRYNEALARLDQARAFPYPDTLRIEVQNIQKKMTVIEQAAGEYFSSIIKQARGLADKEQYEEASALVEQAFLAIGLNSLDTDRQRVLAYISKLRQEKLEQARRAIARKVKQAEKLMSDRKYHQAADIYNGALQQITNQDLKKEINLLYLRARLYKEALNEIIRLLNKANGFDLSTIGAMAGIVKEAKPEGCLVISNETPINLGWKGFRPPEFAALLKLAAEKDGIHSILVYGIESYNRGATARGLEWMQRAMAAASERLQDYNPLYEDYITAHNEARKKAAAEKAAAEKDKPEPPVAAARNNRRQGPGMPDPGQKVLEMGHPRMFMRLRPIPGTDIPDLNGFKTLASRGRRAKFRAGATSKCENAAGYALRYVLNKDAKAADTAIEMMHAPGMIAPGRKAGDVFGWYHTSRWLVPYAMAYDWLYNYPGFDAKEKKAVQKVILEGYRDSMSWLGGGRHLGSNASLIPMAGAYAAAVALYTEETSVQSGFKTIEKFLEQDMPGIYYELNGGWPEGWSYYLESFDWLTVMLEIHHSFTGRDLWRLQYKDNYPYLQFARGFLWGWRPDHTWIRYGDIVSGTKASTRQHVAYFLNSVIQSTKDPELMWLLTDIERVQGVRAYTDSPGNSEFLHYGVSFAMTDSGPKPVKPKELSQVLGEKSYGLMVMRSGWGPNDNMITFRCGDYLGPGHCDYDAGHFSIFSRKGLAIDSGYYATIGSPHYAEYHDKAIAHNVILAGEPGPDGNEGDQRYCRRGTLHNLPDLLNGGSNETGTIITFEDKGNYVYAAGDVSRAYSAGITKWTRELVFIRPNILVILDRVRGAGDKEKRFLLHTVNEPIVKGRNISISNQGSLEVMAVYPQNLKIRTIGGPGKEYWAKGKNWTSGIGGGRDPELGQPGNWRAEIYQEPGSSATTFLTAMTFGPSKVPCQAKPGRDALSVIVNGRYVSFGQVPGSVAIK